MNGAGTRMIWYPRKAAFRAGYVEDTQWDDHSTIQNIGKNSVVFGNSGLASGNDTVIVGGIKNTISGKNSVIVGGYENTIDENSSYSVIVGGGSPNLAEGNAISNSIYSTIVGGKSNQIMDEGNYSTIIGGSNNTISGKYSVAMGKNISISHDSSFVFSDGSEPRQTTGDNQFLIYAKGGVGIAQAPDPNYALSVGGGVKAISFIGDGSQLTNISATKLGGFAPETVASKNSIYVSNADGFLPDNTVSGLSIVDGSITSHDIKDDSITGDQIAPFAITGDKIKPRTITSEQISDGAITADKIQEDAISGENIQNESIVSRNIAPNSIKTPHIADGQVTNIKIAPDTIDSSRIVDASITSKDIGLQAISSINIAEDAIQAHHIAYATIISDNISERAIQAQHLDDLIVSSRVIQDDAILSRHILNKNIQKDHIADGAIEGIHIADAVIINERIIDNSITSSKITPNAILGIHLPDDVIVSRHISEKAILEEHIADIAIGTEKIADNAIVSRNIKNGAVTSEKIAENAIETIHILDGTITSKDIQTMVYLPNEMIADNAIASINIADDAIGGNHIRDDQIGSNHIIDFSIVSRDIKDNAIAAHTAFANGTINSDLIAEGAIQEHHIADNAITSRNIADGSIPWEKITTDPIPEASIADQSIPGSKIKDGTIPGSKIEDGTITSEKLADNSISTNALVGILSVEKGGTGLTQSDITNLKGSVLYGKDDNGTVRLSGDKNHLSWDQVNQRLGINTPTPLAALHVDGSILTTQGIYFGSMENSISFGEDGNGDGFIIIGPETDLSTAGNQQSAVEPQGTLKTKQLYVREKVGIGIQAPVNALDVKGSMAIGSNFAGTRAPQNGLIVEGLVGIGVSAPEHALHVNGSIQAKSIVGKSDSDSVSGIGIKGIAESGAGIGIQSTGSKIGIDVDAKETGIRVVSEGSDGVFVTVKNAVDANAAGVSSEIWDASDQSLAEGVLGKSTGQFSAGVYGWADHSEGSNRWAAYFNGPVRIKKHLGIGNFSDGESPDAPLHVKGHSLFEKTVYSAITDPDENIDWSEGNVQKYTCSSGATLNFEETQLISGVYMLTLIVTVGSSCPQDISDIFPSDIKFSQGITARDVNTNDTLFYSFFLDLNSASSPTYYGIDVIHTSGGGS